MKILEKIFSVKNEYRDSKKYKIVTILGIKLKKQVETQLNIDILHKELERLMQVIERDMHCSYVHQQVFPKYKGVNKGKTVVLCGAGPSLNNYKPMENAIHISLNRAFYFDKVKFDYLFIQDYKGVYPILKDFGKYENPKGCIKFVGTQNDFINEEIPVSKLDFECERFITDNHRWMFNGNIHHFTKDLETQPLGNFGSIVFPAMQFVLYTQPKKIYIVGCDSAPTGHFSGEELESNKRALNDNTYSKLIKQWKEFKEFSDFHYPDIEIISINPVGLKGIFKDMYTE